MAKRARKNQIVFVFIPSCRVAGQDEAMSYVTVRPTAGSTGHILISSLRKYTSYQVVVHAFNNQGQGPSSNVVLATTLEDGEIHFMPF